MLFAHELQDSIGTDCIVLFEFKLLSSEVYGSLKVFKTSFHILDRERGLQLTLNLKLGLVFFMRTKYRRAHPFNLSQIALC